MKCATCGAEHDLLEPTFLRPDAVVDLPSEERAERVNETDDLCAIWARSDAEPHRYFVRCVLKVRLLDAPGDTGWGLWVEVMGGDFDRIVETWSDPDQASVPPMDAWVANQVPDYPDTIGLPVTLHLTGPTTRPQLTLDPGSYYAVVDGAGSGSAGAYTLRLESAEDAGLPARRK